LAINIISVGEMNCEHDLLCVLNLRYGHIVQDFCNMYM